MIETTFSLAKGSTCWLTPQELASCHAIGALRTGSGAGAGVDQSTMFSKQSPLFIDTLGVIGEVALAKMLGLDLNETFAKKGQQTKLKSSRRGTDTAFDLLGIIDVKTPNLQMPPSILVVSWKRDRPCLNYALCSITDQRHDNSVLPLESGCTVCFWGAVRHDTLFRDDNLVQRFGKSFYEVDKELLEPLTMSTSDFLEAPPPQ